MQRSNPETRLRTSVVATAVKDVFEGKPRERAAAMVFIKSDHFIFVADAAGLDADAFRGKLRATLKTGLTLKTARREVVGDNRYRTESNSLGRN